MSKSKVTPAPPVTPAPGTGEPTPAKKEEEDDDSVKPDFIYGPPFIREVKATMFLEETTPINFPLQGTFKNTYAYYSLKERLPVILTKVIDYCSREATAIKTSYSATDADLQKFIQHVSKLKSDLVTNKKYADFTEDSEEAQKWNNWLMFQDPPNYFGNVWVFTECYVYRKLVEGCMLTESLKNFDYFEEQKKKQLQGNLEPMCVVAERMLDSIQPKAEKKERKEEFQALLKVSLWANRCDLSLSVGEDANMSDVAPRPVAPFPPANKKPPKKPKPPPPIPQPTDLGYFDPFQLTLDLKNNVLTDDSGKAFDQLSNKAEKMRKNIEKPPTPPPEPEKPAAPVEGEEPPPEPEKIPCPAKLNVPHHIFFDIVCDNAGYELFADICVAHYLIAQEIVEKVRFHIKKYPWFISDVTRKDFDYLINACQNASFEKTATPPAKVVKEGEEPPPEEPPRVVKSEALRQVAAMWAQYIADGVFIILAEDYWTYPHVYRDMKKYDWYQYRLMQYSTMILFKGDLNYRKLLGDRNAVNTLGLEPNLQGFIPAPIIAVRTVKSELICGLPKGRYDQLNKLDIEWMRKGNFGQIQYCAKGEAFAKQPDRPCLDYGDPCYGQVCPKHTDF